MTETWLAADGATVENVIASEFDDAGRLTSVGDATASDAFAYDAVGRTTGVTATVGTLTSVLTSSYDAAGNRTGLSAQVGSVLDFLNAYGYDDAGRMTSIVQQGQTGGNAVAEKRVDLSYDLLGRFETISRYADAAGTALVATSDYAYDLAGRLTALTHAQGATTLAAYGWTYDSKGRLIQAVSPDGTADYSYDDTDQLTGVDNSALADESYAYDANGNRTGTGHSTGTGNRVLSDGTFDYEYDDEGNRVRKTDLATGDYAAYSYDHRNRLVAVTFYTAAAVKTKRVEYLYDALDRRIGKDVDDDGDGVIDRSERFVYDGGDAVLTTDAAGAVTTRSLHGPLVDQLFADEDALNGVLWGLADDLGTVRDWAAYDAGTYATAVSDHVVYDAFGNVVSRTDPSHVPLSGFTGQDWDADAGLYYYSSGGGEGRWYDPVTGTFSKPDPGSFAMGDANLYRYVGNSPTNFVDPSGLQVAGKASFASRLNPSGTRFDPRTWKIPKLFRPPALVNESVPPGRAAVYPPEEAAKPGECPAAAINTDQGRVPILEGTIHVTPNFVLKDHAYGFTADGTLYNYDGLTVAGAVTVKSNDGKIDTTGQLLLGTEDENGRASVYILLDKGGHPEIGAALRRTYRNYTVTGEIGYDSCHKIRGKGTIGYEGIPLRLYIANENDDFHSGLEFPLPSAIPPWNRP